MIVPGLLLSVTVGVTLLSHTAGAGPSFPSSRPLDVDQQWVLRDGDGAWYPPADMFFSSGNEDDDIHCPQPHQHQGREGSTDAAEGSAYADVASNDDTNETSGWSIDDVKSQVFIDNKPNHPGEETGETSNAVAIADAGRDEDRPLMDAVTMAFPVHMTFVTQGKKEERPDRDSGDHTSTKSPIASDTFPKRRPSSAFSGTLSPSRSRSVSPTATRSSSELSERTFDDASISTTLSTSETLSQQAPTPTASVSLTATATATPSRALPHYVQNLTVLRLAKVTSVAIEDQRANVSGSHGDGGDAVAYATIDVAVSHFGRVQVSHGAANVSYRRRPRCRPLGAIGSNANENSKSNLSSSSHDFSLPSARSAGALMNTQVGDPHANLHRELIPISGGKRGTPSRDNIQEKQRGGGRPPMCPRPDRAGVRFDNPHLLNVANDLGSCAVKDAAASVAAQAAKIRCVRRVWNHTGRLVNRTCRAFGFPDLV